MQESMLLLDRSPASKVRVTAECQLAVPTLAPSASSRCITDGTKSRQVVQGVRTQRGQLICGEADESAGGAAHPF